MSLPRSYDSPKRTAQAAATRTAIVQAFVDQLAEGAELSPTDAARRAGVSVRTVHTYFPDRSHQLVAIADWIDRYTYPDGVTPAANAADLPRYFREVHRLALASPLTRVLLAAPREGAWMEIRQLRRSERLDAIRRAVHEIGAPERETENATAMLLSLAGADASMPLHDLHGLPLDRVPDVIADTVQLIVEKLQRSAADAGSSM